MLYKLGLNFLNDRLDLLYIRESYFITVTVIKENYVIITKLNKMML